MHNSLSGILSMILTLSFIRLVSFAITLPKDFDNLWRPGALSSFPSWILIFIGIVTVYTIYQLVTKLKETNQNIKKAFFFYFGLAYIFMSFFNRAILGYNRSYLYLLHSIDITLDEVMANYILDLFFEPPYIFWFLLFMGFVFYLTNKKNCLEYAIPFWVIPFCYTKFIYNDAIITLYFSGLVTSLIGLNYSKNQSSFGIFILQFLTYLGVISYSHFVYFKETPFFDVAVEIIIIFFTLGFFLIKSCIKSENQAAISATWIIPTATSFFLTLPLYGTPSQFCLASSLSLMNCFVFLGNISLIIIVICLVSHIADKIFYKAGKICSYLLFIMAIAFYFLDGILYFYSHFRMNYGTVAWTMTMNDIAATTLATCLDYLSSTSFTLIILLMLVITISFFNVKKLIVNKPNFRFILLLILIASQFSITLLQLTDPLPQVLRDTAFEMITSLPEPDFFTKPLEFEEIKQGFEECKLPLQEYKESEQAAGNKTNVIFITLESVHWKYVNMFGEEPRTWPLMSKLKDRMEIFPFFFSNFPESTCADHAMVSSLLPYDHLMLSKKNIIHKTIINEVKKAGYNTYIFSSGSTHDGGLINITKTLNFDYFFHYNSKDVESPKDRWQWGYKEEFTAKKILDFLNARPVDKPYFLWYRTVYPHAPFPIFESKDKLVFDTVNRKTMEPSLTGRYKNALIYVDKILFDFINKIDELDKKNNQNTLIFMVGDHGEMLNEEEYKNLNGHGLFTPPSLAAVAAIKINPENRGFKVNTNVGSQIDVLPTLLDWLELKPSIERYGQGVSLVSQPIKERPIYLSSARSYALIENSHFFEFPEKSKPNANIYKLGLTEDSKPAFIKITQWDAKDLGEKYERTKKFFELQKQLFNKL